MVFLDNERYRILIEYQGRNDPGCGNDPGCEAMVQRHCRFVTMHTAYAPVEITNTELYAQVLNAQGTRSASLNGINSG